MINLTYLLVFVALLGGCSQSSKINSNLSSSPSTQPGGGTASILGNSNTLQNASVRIGGGAALFEFPLRDQDKVEFTWDRGLTPAVSNLSLLFMPNEPGLIQTLLANSYQMALGGPCKTPDCNLLLDQSTFQNTNCQTSLSWTQFSPGTYSFQGVKSDGSTRKAQVTFNDVCHSAAINLTQPNSGDTFPNMVAWVQVDAVMLQYHPHDNGWFQFSYDRGINPTPSKPGMTFFPFEQNMKQVLLIDNYGVTHNYPCTPMGCAAVMTSSYFVNTTCGGPIPWTQPIPGTYVIVVQYNDGSTKQTRIQLEDVCQPKLASSSRAGRAVASVRPQWTSKRRVSLMALFFSATALSALALRRKYRKSKG